MWDYTEAKLPALESQQGHPPGTVLAQGPVRLEAISSRSSLWREESGPVQSGPVRHVDVQSRWGRVGEEMWASCVDISLVPPPATANYPQPLPLGPGLG